MTNFKGSKNFEHGKKISVGVLLCNLGTPDKPTRKAVKRYLAEFLSDPRIVELPRILWLPILHGIILNTRPTRSARAYSKIWTKSGSPLLFHSKNLKTQIERDLDRSWVTFELGMRYGNPSIGSALEALIDKGARQILVVPMYPQYAAATTGSIYDAVFNYCSSLRWVPQIRFTSNYHNEESYISALAKKITDHWAQKGRSDKLLFSFHGIPKSTFLEGDPYHCQCQETARLVCEKIEIKPESAIVTFQSRVGFGEWLTPYTDDTLKNLATSGISTVDVICPGFAVDCLETLEEIAIQNKELFIEHGGKRLTYIDALNDSQNHVNLLSALIKTNLGDWYEVPPSTPEGQSTAAKRARAMALEKNNDQ